MAMGRFSLCVFLGVCWLSVAPPTASAAALPVDAPLPNTWYNENLQMHLSWAVDAASEVLTLEVSAIGSAFVGVGFGGSMNSTDMVIGWVFANGTAGAGDFYSFGHEHPKLDTTLPGGHDDVTLVSGSRVGNTTTYRVTRKLDTGDKWDTVLSTTAPTDIIYASQDGDPGAIQFHFDRHNHARVDLSKPNGVPDTQFGQEEVGLASRQLVNRATYGTLVTLQSEVMVGREQFAGFPYGSVASFADDEPSTGHPILLLSQLERNVINWEDDARCTLAIQDPPTNGSEPMMQPRTTLFGTLVEVPAAGVAAARKAYLAKHPIAKYWIDFDGERRTGCPVQRRARHLTLVPRCCVPPSSRLCALPLQRD